LIGRTRLSGYAINGATGEFTAGTEEELETVLAETRAAAPEAEILCGVGAADVYGAVRRGRIAARAGAKALLLPMPYFFPYRQDDLHAFALDVASKVEVPVLLYNLPQFTSGLAVDTVLSLLEHENIVGIKDSSGSLEIVRAITEAKMPAARLIGNDGALCDALEQKLCDGVVSGVACTLPELMSRIFESGRAGKDFVGDRRLLDEFIEQLNPLPTPWGLKVASAVRGYTRESYPFALSKEREGETAHLRTWFADWQKNL
jgi:4-hydroxy-tetrahydrodipicolinate synthase